MRVILRQMMLNVRKRGGGGVLFTYRSIGEICASVPDLLHGALLMEHAV
jgi:hypothetical protein